MALETPTSPPSHRIKRKPPPNISEAERAEIERAEIKRCLVPDSCDSLALSTCAQSDVCPFNTGKRLSVCSPPGLTPEADDISTQRHLSNIIVQQDSHYKLRSQSTQFSSSPQATRVYHDDSGTTSPTPSFIHSSSSDDSATDVETEPSTMDSSSTTPGSSSPIKFPRPILPPKAVTSSARPQTATATMRAHRMPSLSPLATSVHPSTESVEDRPRLMSNPMANESTLRGFPSLESIPPPPPSLHLAHGHQPQPEFHPSILHIPSDSKPSTNDENRRSFTMPGRNIPLTLDTRAPYAYISFPSPAPVPPSVPAPRPTATTLPVAPRRNTHRPSTAPSGGIRNGDLRMRPQKIREPQGEWTLPTTSQLADAALLPIIAESGVRIPFGSVFGNQRAIVIFIRHFWCPLCQDYMTSLISLVPPALLSSSLQRNRGGQDKPRLVVISNGAYTLIPKYRQIFGTQVAMYTDPTLMVYATLGMGMMRDDKLIRNAPGTAECKKAKDGAYVKHGLLSGIAMVVVRALRVGMPVWEKGGDIGQLGGEFVLGPGLTCSFAHRMQHSKDHAPIMDVLKAADISGFTVRPLPLLSSRSENDLAASSHARRPSAPSIKEMRRQRKNASKENVKGKTEKAIAKERVQPATAEPGETEEHWMKERQQSLERLRQKKMLRRLSSFPNSGQGKGHTSSKNGNVAAVEEPPVAGQGCGADNYSNGVRGAQMVRCR